jgi:hypothetical protein
MLYGVSNHAYLNANSQQEAVAMCNKLKELLQQPMIRGILKANGVTVRDGEFLVIGTPVAMPDQR